MESAVALIGDRAGKMQSFDLHCGILFLHPAVVPMLSVCFYFNEDVNFHPRRCAGHSASALPHIPRHTRKRCISWKF